MEVSFMEFLEQSLQVNEANRKKIAQDDEELIQVALAITEYGVCSGCRTELKKVEYPKLRVSHMSNAAADVCQYTDGYGTVPEWAFFPHELFEE